MTVQLPGPVSRPVSQMAVCPKNQSKEWHMPAAHLQEGRVKMKHFTGPQHLQGNPCFWEAALWANTADPHDAANSQVQEGEGAGSAPPLLCNNPGISCLKKVTIAWPPSKIDTAVSPRLSTNEQLRAVREALLIREGKSRVSLPASEWRRAGRRNLLIQGQTQTILVRRTEPRVTSHSQKLT